MQIKAEQIQKIIGGNVLFEGLQLEVNKGEHVAIVGVNGSGKTTLLQLLAGLDTPDAGRIIILPHNPAIRIERVTDANVQEALEVEMTISTFGEPALIKRAFENMYCSPHFTYYLLKIDGVACCTANLFLSGRQGRIESVATLESYRGRGLIGYVLQHIQKEAVKNNLEHLWLLPINEQVAKVYERANFYSFVK
ncbi:hypothetical protein LSPH26S_04768 [Lysinibacillus sphaericus]